MFTRLHAIVIPLMLVGLLGFCFVTIQQTTDGVVHILMDTLLVEPGGEQSDPPLVTYQQLRRVMASTKYYRMGFYGGAFLSLVYMITMATRPTFKPAQPAFKPAQPTPRPVPSTPQQAQPLPTQMPPEPQQAASAPQRPIPGPVRLADDVNVGDEQPMLTAELPRPTDIVMRSNDQATPAPQRPIPDSVRLADDVSVEDEQPILTAELPRPTDIAMRSKSSERSS